MDPEMEKLRGIYAQQLDFYGHGEAAVLSVDMNPLLLGHVLLQEEAFPLRRDAVLFEGVRLPAFRNPEAYLKKTYGDYMQLPPVEHRVTHHTFDAWWKDDIQK